MIPLVSMGLGIMKGITNMIKNVSGIWNTFGYTRVSAKDGRRVDESNSIKSQKDLILDFSNRNPDINILDIVVEMIISSLIQYPARKLAGYS